jgi:phage-related holin
LPEPSFKGAGMENNSNINRFINQITSSDISNIVKYGQMVDWIAKEGSFQTPPVEFNEENLGKLKDALASGNLSFNTADGLKKIQELLYGTENPAVASYRMNCLLYSLEKDGFIKLSPKLKEELDGFFINMLIDSGVKISSREAWNQLKPEEKAALIGPLLNKTDAQIEDLYLDHIVRIYSDLIMDRLDAWTLDRKYINKSDQDGEDIRDEEYIRKALKEELKKNKALKDGTISIEEIGNAIFNLSDCNTSNTSPIFRFRDSKGANNNTMAESMASYDKALESGKKEDIETYKSRMISGALSIIFSTALKADALGATIEQRGNRESVRGMNDFYIYDQNLAGADLSSILIDGVSFSDGMLATDSNSGFSVVSSFYDYDQTVQSDLADVTVNMATSNWGKDGVLDKIAPLLGLSPDATQGEIEEKISQMTLDELLDFLKEVPEVLHTSPENIMANGGFDLIVQNNEFKAMMKESRAALQAAVESFLVTGNFSAILQELQKLVSTLQFIIKDLSKSAETERDVKNQFADITQNLVSILGLSVEGLESKQKSVEIAKGALQEVDKRQNLVKTIAMEVAMWVANILLQFACFVGAVISLGTASPLLVPIAFLAAASVGAATGGAGSKIAKAAIEREIPARVIARIGVRPNEKEDPVGAANWDIQANTIKKKMLQTLNQLIAGFMAVEIISGLLGSFNPNGSISAAKNIAKAFTSASAFKSALTEISGNVMSKFTQNAMKNGLAKFGANIGDEIASVGRSIRNILQKSVDDAIHDMTKIANRLTKEVDEAGKAAIDDALKAVKESGDELKEALKRANDSGELKGFISNKFEDCAAFNKFQGDLGKLQELMQGQFNRVMTSNDVVKAARANGSFFANISAPFSKGTGTQALSEWAENAGELHRLSGLQKIGKSVSMIWKGMSTFEKVMLPISVGGAVVGSALSYEATGTGGTVSRLTTEKLEALKARAEEYAAKKVECAVDEKALKEAEELYQKESQEIAADYNSKITQAQTIFNMLSSILSMIGMAMMFSNMRSVSDSFAATAENLDEVKISQANMQNIANKVNKIQLTASKMGQDIPGNISEALKTFEKNMFEALTIVDPDKLKEKMDKVLKAVNKELDETLKSLDPSLLNESVSAEGANSVAVKYLGNQRLNAFLSNSINALMFYSSIINSFNNNITNLIQASTREEIAKMNLEVQEFNLKILEMRENSKNWEKMNETEQNKNKTISSEENDKKITEFLSEMLSLLTQLRDIASNVNKTFSN